MQIHVCAAVTPPATVVSSVTFTISVDEASPTPADTITVRMASDGSVVEYAKIGTAVTFDGALAVINGDRVNLAGTSTKTM